MQTLKVEGMLGRELGSDARAGLNIPVGGAMGERVAEGQGVALSVMPAGEELGSAATLAEVEGAEVGYILLGLAEGNTGTLEVIGPVDGSSVGSEVGTAVGYSVGTDVGYSVVASMGIAPGCPLSTV